MSRKSHSLLGGDIPDGTAALSRVGGHPRTATPGGGQRGQARTPTAGPGQPGAECL
jgi:hypothetical protein